MLCLISAAVLAHFASCGCESEPLESCSNWIKPWEFTEANWCRDGQRPIRRSFSCGELRDYNQKLWAEYRQEVQPCFHRIFFRNRHSNVLGRMVWQSVIVVQLIPTGALGLPSAIREASTSPQSFTKKFGIGIQFSYALQPSIFWGWRS